MRDTQKQWAERVFPTVWNIIGSDAIVSVIVKDLRMRADVNAAADKASRAQAARDAEAADKIEAAWAARKPVA